MKTLSSEYLVESDWLEKNIERKDLRIIDCHYFIEFNSDHKPLLTSGRQDWEASHIQNSCFIDLLNEVSDRNSDLPFMMPPINQFKDVLARKGINDKSSVIIYDRGENLWSSRFWWMLRYSGFNNAAVLNGGWKKWEAEKRAVTGKFFAIKPTVHFSGAPRQNLFVNKTDVIKSQDHGSSKLICFLEKEMFQMGHIPNSMNIPAIDMINPADNTFLSVAELRKSFEKYGLNKEDRIITYCGGAIAGSFGAFVLTMAGYKNVSVYDGSMEEWSKDPKLPIEIG